ncbi:uncharacterized protein ASCRUDRAFT_106132 [Ascoidea rubescens DSM 1968]|uniref:Uncharacterized protein n=1 Tax=Ascoidea rubescens DSM 1968 TaxID=1344418 RepID=A0A1D2VSF7_9ASCO|nr:hypothetical protein ASCRUDRAFT_106132 [Ascoidea rubescens DSM 1968]ODV64544.1 hypothetical protein ASCRUDRAFT_106132 [Ascoidea rubescens DSM 1968]
MVTLYLIWFLGTRDRPTRLYLCFHESNKSSSCLRCVFSAFSLGISDVLSNQSVPKSLIILTIRFANAIFSFEGKSNTPIQKNSSKHSPREADLVYFFLISDSQLHAGVHAYCCSRKLKSDSANNF